MKSEKERMLAGELYQAGDPELRAMSARRKQILRLFNQTTEEQGDYRVSLLKKLFGKTGQNIHIEPEFHCDYGVNTYLGENFYANYDCIFLDIAPIHIGDNVMLAPRVCLYTAGHPIDAEVRNEQLEYGYPITIGNNVWIGGSTVVNPGVTIGDNTVIGSGSVVTKDIPANVIAVGNPCRVLRPITQADHDYWQAQRDKYYQE